MKQYTREEIIAACADVFKLNENPSFLEQKFFEDAVHHWLDCANYLGALKVVVNREGKT